jgi:glutathione-independent formaldehyde dehydrogenase
MMPGGAYGYAGMGGWQGGMAEYVMVPFADFNLLLLPSESKNFWDKIEDYALITDVLPTALHGVVSAEVSIGSTVFICGAGPVGLSAAHFCFKRGAAVVVVADRHAEKLKHAKSIGCVTIDVKTSTEDEIYKFCKELLNGEEFDIGMDCVGYEAKRIGHGSEGTTSKIKDALKWTVGYGSENPTEVLDLLFRVVRSTGKVSVPGVFFSPDPKPTSISSGMGKYQLGFALAWNKCISIVGTGQCPVKRYNRNLMKSIQHDQLSVSSLLNIEIISMDEAPKAYKAFNEGIGKKFIIDPHGIISEHRRKKII